MHQTSWSDGLGDPKRNTLARCQLERLARFINDLPAYPESADIPSTTLPLQNSSHPKDLLECSFWMDTLCVPKHPTLRDRSIVKMREVYHSAANVLVLDADLMATSAFAPYTQIFTSITCSTWLRRLWTLQEGTLNRNVLFQFSEKAVYAGHRSALKEAQKKDNLEKPWDLVALECKRYMLDHLDLFPYYTYMFRIGLIWDSIKNRTTSRPGTDEPLCLALLLDLEVDKLQAEPDAYSVKKFWSLHDKGVPAYVLFLPGRKLPDKGYGWAPADLKDLMFLSGNIPDPIIPGTVTSNGLRVSFPGFALGQPRNPTRSVISCEIDGAILYVRHSLTDGTASWEGLELHKRKRLAVILLVIFGEPKKGEGIELARGALVEICEGSVWLPWPRPFQPLYETFGISPMRYVNYLRCVTVVKKGCFSDQHPNVPWSDVGKEEKAMEPIKGTYFPMDQQWCVG